MTVIRMREEGFPFVARHTIPSFPPDSRDREPHPHEFRVAVEVSTTIDPERGYAFDHCIVAEGVEDCTRLLNGKYINDIAGLERGLVEDILLCFFVPKLLHYFMRRTATLQLVELRQIGLTHGMGSVLDMLTTVRPTGRDHVKIWRADENPIGA